MSRRFVILRHVVPATADRADHWDLMLEFEDSLRTWALADQPRSKAEIGADILPDHRLAYLEYEGPVSRNRGHVTRFESGTYAIVQQNENTLIVELHGSELHCHAEIHSLSSEKARITFGDKL